MESRLDKQDASLSRIWYQTGGGAPTTCRSMIERRKLSNGRRRRKVTRSPSRRVQSIDKGTSEVGLGRVIGSAANLAAAKLDAWANEIRNVDRMDSAIYDAAVKTIGDDEEQISRILGEISAGHIRKIANKKHVVERAIEHIGDPQPEGESLAEDGEVQSGLAGLLWRLC